MEEKNEAFFNGKCGMYIPYVYAHNEEAIDYNDFKDFYEEDTEEYDGGFLGCYEEVLTGNRWTEKEVNKFDFGIDDSYLTGIGIALYLNGEELTIIPVYAGGSWVDLLIETDSFGEFTEKIENFIKENIL